MPEAPDLEVIKEFLNARVSGAEVADCLVLRPTVVRSLNGDIAKDLPGRSLEGVGRTGKFLALRFSGGRKLIINPMLTGAVQYCGPSERVQKRVCLSLTVTSDGEERQIRYLDDRQMGKVYYVADGQESEVPQYIGLGPDVLSGISLDEFKTRLRRFNGEIKGVLTRGGLISGIGNAYSDEILFAAGISPFRKARSLNPDEVAALHAESRRVVEDAIVVLRERMGDDIHHKVRDFLKVHNKGGEPCPACGAKISQLTANRRNTSYCRHCQPGMLIRN